MNFRPCQHLTDCQDNSAQTSTIEPKPRQSNRFINLLCRIFNYLRKTPSLWIPLALLILATTIFRITNVDLMLSRLFFEDNSSAAASGSHWPLRIVQPWISLYYWGIYPAWIIGVGGLLVAVISLFWVRLRPYRNAGLFFFLMLALGPGLLINGIFKPYWGRPRPHDTIPFSGQQPYLPVGDMGTTGFGASFPSGHASMGFYLMAPGFVLYRRWPKVAAMFFALGLSGGIIMGMARIVAGSHFASDVVWSAGIVYFTGLGLSALFRFGDMQPKAPGASS
jgi:lipid A 4'-phosphatase